MQDSTSFDKWSTAKRGDKVSSALYKVQVYYVPIILLNNIRYERGKSTVSISTLMNVCLLDTSAMVFCNLMVCNDLYWFTLPSKKSAFCDYVFYDSLLAQIKIISPSCCTNKLIANAHTVAR